MLAAAELTEEAAGFDAEFRASPVFGASAGRDSDLETGPTGALRLGVP
jgi:hypothetical protein